MIPTSAQGVEASYGIAQTELGTTPKTSIPIVTRCCRSVHPLINEEITKVVFAFNIELTSIRTSLLRKHARNLSNCLIEQSPVAATRNSNVHA